MVRVGEWMVLVEASLVVDDMERGDKGPGDVSGGGVGGSGGKRRETLTWVLTGIYRQEYLHTTAETTNITKKKIMLNPMKTEPR